MCQDDLLGFLHLAGLARGRSSLWGAACGDALYAVGHFVVGYPPTAYTRKLGQFLSREFKKTLRVTDAAAPQASGVQDAILRCDCER